MSRIHRPRAALVVLSTCVLFGCQRESSHPRDAGALIASGQAHLQRHETRAAIIEFKNALQATPDSAAARHGLGRSLLEAGDPAGALVELRRAAELHQPADDTQPLIADSLVALGDDARVVQEFAATRLTGPQAEAALRTAVAGALERLGRDDEARDALALALRSVPGFLPARIADVRRVLRQGDIAVARERAAQIVRDAPQQADAWRLEGDLRFLAEGDRPAALVAYRQALTLQPRLLDAHAAALWLLLGQGDLAAARGQWQALRTAWPGHPQTRYFEAEIALRAGDLERARTLVQQLLAVNPQDARVLLLGGRVALQDGTSVQAERLLGQAVQAAPDDVSARRLLARARLGAGDARGALAALAPVLATARADAAVLGLAAEAESRLAHRDAAVALLQRAAALDAGDAASRAALALKTGAPRGSEDHVAQLERIAASDDTPLADQALVAAALQRHDLDAAAAAVAGLVRKQPRDPVAAVLYGRVHLARGDVAAARREFDRAFAIDPANAPAAASLADLDVAEQHVAQALERYERIATADPRNVDALLGQARVRARTGAAPAEVARLIERAVAVDPSDVGARVALVDHRLQRGDATGALASADAALTALPDRPELLDAKGRALASAGRLDEAAAAFEQLALRLPDRAEPHVRLADVALQAGRSDVATLQLRRALALAPDAVALQRQLIAVQAGAGRWRDALAVAHEVQTQRPADAVGHVFEGDLEAAQQHWPAAEAAYRAALRRAGSDAGGEVAIKLHGMLLAAGRPADAETLAAARVKEAPGEARFALYLGEQALADRRYAAAEAAYRRVPATSPDYAAALNNLAWVRLQLRQPDALALAEQANRLRPDQPSYLDTLAAVLAGDRQFGRALEVQKRALAIDPQNHPLRMGLARIYLQAGDKAQARAELDTLARLGSAFTRQAEVGELLRTL